MLSDARMTSRENLESLIFHYRARNEPSPRVGIHVGDVIEDGAGDILGDAVNVASRIQSLAPEGGVCLTQQVFDHVRNKFEPPFKSIGKKSLKNVNIPVQVYEMVMPWDDAIEVAVTKMTELAQEENCGSSFFGISVLIQRTRTSPTG